MKFMWFLLLVPLGLFLHNILVLAGIIVASLMNRLLHTNSHALALFFGLHLPYFIAGFLLARTNGVVWPRLVVLSSAILVSCIISANSNLRWQEEHWITYAPPVLTSFIGASIALYLSSKSSVHSNTTEAVASSD